jgi:hypothetical protein
MKARLLTYTFLVPEDVYRSNPGYLGRVSAAFVNSQNLIGHADLCMLADAEVEVNDCRGYEVDFKDWFQENNNNNERTEDSSSSNQGTG